MSKDRALRAGELLYFAIAYGGSAVLHKALGFAVFMWLARSLSVREYATFGLLLALQTGLATLAGAGIVESVIATLKTRGNFDLRSGLFGAANSVFALLAIPPVIFVVVVDTWLLGDGSVAPLTLGCVVVSGLLTAYTMLQANLVRLEESHPEAIVLGFFGPVGGFMGGIVAFLIAPSVGAFFVGSACGLMVATLGLAAMRFGFHRFEHAVGEVPLILTSIAPFICIALLSWLGGYGSTYLVNSFFTASEVARFTFAFTLAAIMQLVATSLNQVWAPRFYRLLADQPPDSLERNNRRFFVFQGLALGLVGGAVLVLFPGALELVGGNLPAYGNLTLELLFLFLGYAVSIPWWHAQNYYYGTGRGRELMNVTIVGSVAGLLAWIAAALAFGAVGIYIGFMLQMLTRAVVAYAAARRQWSVSLQWEGVMISAPLLVAGGAMSTAIY